MAQQDQNGSKSYRGSFRELKTLTVYSLYIQEACPYAKEKCNCAVNISKYISEHKKS
jgi:hypothetical protein